MRRNDGAVVGVESRRCLVGHLFSEEGRRRGISSRVSKGKRKGKRWGMHEALFNEAAKRWTGDNFEGPQDCLCLPGYFQIRFSVRYGHLAFKAQLRRTEYGVQLATLTTLETPGREISH